MASRLTMRILPLTVLLLLLTSVVSTPRPSTRTTHSNAILDTIAFLERELPKSTTPNTDLATTSRQAVCRSFTFRRAIGCLCEITRAQRALRTIPSGPSLIVIRSCASLLGVGRKRFSRICGRLGFDISGDPRTSINGLRTAMGRCGGSGLGSLGLTMI